MPFSCCCGAAALALLTQSAWFVNSATGNNNNDGASATTALATIPELERRLNGRIYDPAVPAVSISIVGDFSAYSLMLAFTMTAPGATVDITGSMASVFTGTIATYVPFTPGALRATLNDLAANFGANKLTRVRMTSGAALNGVTHFASVAAADTANIGQFYTSAGLLGTKVNPANGDTYIVESYNTRLRDYIIDIRGAIITLRDIRWVTAAASTSSSLSLAPDNFHLKVFGCQFACDGVLHDIKGSQALICNLMTGAGAVQTLGDGFQSWKSNLISSGQPVIHAVGSNIQAVDNMHDGDGARNSGMRVIDNSEVADTTTQRCFFGVVNGTITALVRVSSGYYYSEGATQVWGAAGNTTTNAFQVRNGAGGTYTTKPVCTGNTPGVNDIVIGGVGMAWAAVPFINAAPNNGYFVADA